MNPRVRLKHQQHLLLPLLLHKMKHQEQNLKQANLTRTNSQRKGRKSLETKKAMTSTLLMKVGLSWRRSAVRQPPFTGWI